MNRRPAQRATGGEPRLIARINECAALFRQGQADRALAGLRKLLEKHPAHPGLNHITATVLLALNKPEQAAYHGERAAASDPNDARAHLALGQALLSLNRVSEALTPLEDAVRIDKDNPEMVAALGGACSRAGRYEQAETLLRRAMSLRPDWMGPVMSLATLYTNTARAHEAVRLLEPILSDPAGGSLAGVDPASLIHAAGTLAFASSYDDRITPEQAAECHRIFGRCAASIARPIGPFANTPDPERRIRLGLLSAELREHSNSFFLRPILENLDKDRFELVCFHTSRHEDAVTAVIRSHADRWVACDDLSPADLARRIHREGVDVLIELTGHFARNRLISLAARPAPVQVTYLGYGNTTGLPLDARIIDADTDPAPDADALATEPLVRLDRCFLAYRPPDAAPEPGEPGGGRPFTFASFNDIKKLSPSVIALWSRVLDACPGSRLLVKTGELSHAPMREMIGARFRAHGVGDDRLVLRGRVDPASAHLAMYDEADLALDTFPYAGTTTTCEAMWQGVPVLTLAGHAHAGRVGVSLLRTAGMGDHIAADEDGYVRLASLAFRAGRLGRDRRLALRARVASSPLLDHAALTRSLERALRNLWRGWCEQRNGATP